jgi:cobaltochelatase CobN
LGGRQGFIHGFDRLAQAANRLGKDLICIPGAEGLDPELTAYSTVPVPVIHDVYNYLHYGGVDNMRQMLHFLADHLLAGGWGCQPVEQPGTSSTRKHSHCLTSHRLPHHWYSFLSRHWLSGNTDFIDA